MSASVVLIHRGEGLERRKECGVLLHLIIVELDVRLALSGHGLPVEPLAVLRDEPAKQDINHNTQGGGLACLCRRSRFPLSSILNSRDL